MLCLNDSALIVIQVQREYIEEEEEEEEEELISIT